MATILATAAAVFGGRVAYQAYLRERARDHRSQADAVHAWLASTSEEGRGRTHLVILNAGEALIYEVRASVLINGNEDVAPAPDKTWTVIPPGTYVVKPDPRYRWSLPEQIDDTSGYRPYTRNEKYAVTAIDFIDARRVRWRRDESGRLVDLGAS